MRNTHRTLGPLQLVRGLTSDRNRPDFASLNRELDPERFLWKILPHAARSFAASIVVLPGEQARADAVAYLYCRMLDTYEDLIEDTAACAFELDRFATRFEGGQMVMPTSLPESMARDVRDRVYLLLIRRCELIDSIYMELSPEVRGEISSLVRSMSDGMVWSTRAFSDQGGVLLDEDQLATYCRNVIGYPALFTLSQVSNHELTDGVKEDAFLISEMIQLANVSRDIERDLERGIAYHPELKPFLGRSGYDPASLGTVSEVREQYMAMALSRAPAYRRIFEGLNLGGTASVRIASVLMLLFTDLHYRSCAVSTGNSVWPGPGSRLQVIATALPSLASRTWAGHTVRRIDSDFLNAVLNLRKPLATPALTR